MDNLNSKIKSYYLSKNLTEEQLRKITNSKARIGNKLFVTPNILKYASVFIAILGISYCIYILSSYQKNNLLESYASEVAYNHKKQLPVEFTSSNIPDLQDKFKKLDFKLEFPELLKENYKIIGGRYCSVDNKIASQLNIKTKNNKTATLYVFKKDEKLTFDLKNYEMDGVKVMIWHSSDLIFALVE